MSGHCRWHLGAGVVAVLSCGPAWPTWGQCPPVYVYDGVAPHDYLGWSVSGAGDVDGDGFDDFLIGTVGYDNPEGVNLGKVTLFSGATGEVLRFWIGELSTTSGGAFGAPVAGAGDVDGDEVPDVIVGARTFKTSGGWAAGRVYVFSGRTGELIWSWDGDREKAYFGDTVGGAGDVNRDGHADLIVGQPGFNSGEIEFPGMAYVYSGATGELLWSRPGDAPADHFGWSVAGAGDFNNDGYDDVVVGAPWNNPSKAYVLSGPTGEVLWYEEYLSESPAGDIFGCSVSGVGDMNRDGYADVIVGAYQAGGPTPNSDYGMAFVFAGPDGDLLWALEGDPPGGLFGYSVSGTGDVNGDSVPDVIVGAYGYPGSAGWMSGKAYVFSGATGHVLWSWEGEGVMDFFGNAVSGAGDVDADGLGDVIVGAKTHDGPGGATSGRAYVFKPVTLADCDCDGTVGLMDYAAFGDCFGGSGGGLTLPECQCADFDADGDVDLKDFRAFQVAVGQDL